MWRYQILPNGGDCARLVLDCMPEQVKHIVSRFLKIIFRNSFDVPSLKVPGAYERCIALLHSAHMLLKVLIHDNTKFLKVPLRMDVWTTYDLNSHRDNLVN